MTALPGLSKGAFAIIFCVSMATAMGVSGLQSVLPAIGRSIGIADPMIAAIFSLSSLLWAVSSQFWANQSDRRGRKPLMMVGLAGYAVSMVLCGFVVSAGLTHIATPVIAFGLLLVFRAIYGLFGCATTPAIQAFIAERTPSAGRARWISAAAGATSVGTVVGPAIAPLFIVGSLGYAGPLYGFALIAAAMLFVVKRFLVEVPIQSTETPVTPSQHDASVSLWLSPSFAPFIVYGFLLLACQNALAQTLGFLIIDKTHGAMPSVEYQALLIQAQSQIAIAMAGGATASLLALWVFIPLLGMTPRTLLRWGAALAGVGNAMVALSPNYQFATAGYVLACLGFSFARPGFMAGASVSVSMKDQARMAGIIGTITGANSLLAPLAVLLYGVFAPAPFLLASVVLFCLLGYTYVNTALRNVGAQS